jgi:hypothetical protein
MWPSPTATPTPEIPTSSFFPRRSSRSVGAPDHRERGGYRRLSSDHNVATDAPVTARTVWTSKSAEEHLGLRKQFR